MQKKEKTAAIVIGLLVIGLLAYLLYLQLTTPTVGGGGGGAPSTSTTTSPGLTLQPKSGPPNPASIVYVPDYVTCGASACTYSIQAYGSAYDIIAYGGSVTSANVTYGNAYVPVAGYQIYLFGVASTNPIVNFTDTSNAIYVWGNATKGVGYILYKPAGAAVLLTAYTYNITGVLYYVFVPASSDNGMTISGANYRIYVVHGTAYVNGQPVQISLGSWASPPKGVLPAWAIYVANPGIYAFTVSP